MLKAVSLGLKQETLIEDAMSEIVRAQSLLDSYHTKDSSLKDKVCKTHKEIVEAMQMMETYTINTLITLAFSEPILSDGSL